ncbi:AraC family transcriptional regulator, partial [Burkholderia multivorans]
MRICSMLAPLIYTERFCHTGTGMKQEDKGTVAIGLVAYSVALAVRRGVAAAPLLAQAGIAPALLEQPRARVSAQQYGALWNAIARALD